MELNPKSELSGTSTTNETRRLEIAKSKAKEDTVVAIKDIVSRVMPKGYDRIMNTNLDLTREQGKRLLWHVIKAWEELSKETYQYLGNSKYVIVEFIGYFLGHSTTLDIRKGIYLYGDYGRGKTLLFRLFSSFTKCTTYRPFDIANCKEIEIEVSEAGDLGPLRKYLSGVWCFNDLGYESRVTKLYGQDVSLMEYILGERSERSLITFATGNLPPQELEKRYGDRIKTRLHSLFNFIELEGPRDFRKTLDNAKSS